MQTFHAHARSQALRDKKPREENSKCKRTDIHVMSYEVSLEKCHATGVVSDSVQQCALPFRMHVRMREHVYKMHAIECSMQSR